MLKKSIIPVFILVMLGLLLVITVACKKKNPTGTSLQAGCEGKSMALFNSALSYGTMKDIDGNLYMTITIGSQTWMAENLRTTKYRDGTPIYTETGLTAWPALQTGACCTYNNTENCDSVATYGRLYNFYAVSDQRNLAPLGWHVPTGEDWLILASFLGVRDSIAFKLKECGTIHWHPSTILATNSSGFTALPGGLRNETGSFTGKGVAGTWWSADMLLDNNANAFFIFNSDTGLDPVADTKSNGHSVRCVRDI